MFSSVPPISANLFLVALSFLMFLIKVADHRSVAKNLEKRVKLNFSFLRVSFIGTEFFKVYVHRRSANFLLY